MFFFCSSIFKFLAFFKAYSKLNQRQLEELYRNNQIPVLADGFYFIFIENDIEANFQRVVHPVDQIAVVLQIFPFKHVFQLSKKHSLKKNQRKIKILQKLKGLPRSECLRFPLKIFLYLNCKKKTLPVVFGSF